MVLHPRSASLSPRTTFFDYSPVQESFRHAFLSGLSQPQKSIPCRFLYDDEGSQIFNKICEVPEYYLTRTECEILSTRSAELAQVIGPQAALIEFGPGSSLKARLVLKDLKDPVSYVPIDVSRQHLIQLAKEISEEHPKLEVNAVCADYTQPLTLPQLQARRNVGFFPGSTVGNLNKEEVVQFLKHWAVQLGEGGAMIIGVDLKKSAEIVVPTYNHPVLAAMMLNILKRANRELHANFVAESFEVKVDYNDTTGRVAIYLESQKDQVVAVPDGTFRFGRGELLHLNDSNKYTIDDFQALATQAGYESEAVFVDSKQLFSVLVLRVVSFH